jgi:hypothetical protein
MANELKATYSVVEFVQSGIRWVSERTTRDDGVELSNNTHPVYDEDGNPVPA